MDNTLVAQTVQMMWGMLSQLVAFLGPLPSIVVGMGVVGWIIHLLVTLLYVNRVGGGPNGNQ